MRLLGPTGPSVVTDEASVERVSEDPVAEEQADVGHLGAGNEAGGDGNLMDSTPRSKKNYAGEGDDEYDDEDDDYEDGVLVPGTLSQGRATAPFWHWPCGRSVDLVVVPAGAGRSRAKGHRRPKSVGRRINDALEKVWRQLNMTVLHYRLQRFDKLYYQVRRGVDRVWLEEG